MRLEYLQRAPAMITKRFSLATDILMSINDLKIIRRLNQCKGLKAMIPCLSLSSRNAFFFLQTIQTQAKRLLRISENLHALEGYCCLRYMLS